MNVYIMITTPGTWATLKPPHASNIYHLPTLAFFSNTFLYHVYGFLIDIDENLH